MAVESQDLFNDVEDRISEILHSSLPLARVKRICRLDPDLTAISNDAAKMVTKATELFIKELAKACYTEAILNKRKTLQAKDIDSVIKSNWLFSLLEDALDGWPEPAGRGKEHHENEAESANIAEVSADEVIAIEEGEPEEIGVDGDVVEETTEAVAEVSVEDTIEETQPLNGKEDDSESEAEQEVENDMEADDN